jgi:hypothetical protein
MNEVHQSFMHLLLVGLLNSQQALTNIQYCGLYLQQHNTIWKWKTLDALCEQCLRCFSNMPKQNWLQVDGSCLVHFSHFFLLLLPPFVGTNHVLVLPTDCA